MKAVIASAQFGTATLITDRPRPRLRPTYLLIRTIAVAVNPADNLYLSYGLAGKGSLLGNDYAGIVEEVGCGVKRSFRVGDRVCGCTRGGDPDELENGTAAEYIVVKADLQVHIPASMSFEEAATTGVTFLTTGRCLYKTFNIPFPSPFADAESGKERGALFIYGGSTAMGTALAQFANLSGFSVLTVASPHKFDLCKSYGADRVLDYRDPSAPDKIKTLAKGKVLYAIDCISGGHEQGGVPFCREILAPRGTYSVLGPSVTLEREDVREVVTVGYSFLGEEWGMMGQRFEASREDFEFSVRFAEVVEKLLESGRVRGHPVEIREGGLDAFVGAMEDLKEKRVSGKKLVVTVGEV